MGRAPCCDKGKVKKGPWSPEEDSKLKDYIHKNGSPGNWIALPSKAGLRRCGKSCRLRWLNYLRPNIKHGDFTPDEDTIICNLFSTIGSRWSIIAAQLPGRTDNDIKNYWNTKLKKKLLGMMMTSAGAGATTATPSSSSFRKRIPAAGTTDHHHHHHPATTNYYYNISQHQSQLTTPPPPPAVAASLANGGLMDDNNNYYFSSSTSSLLINSNNYDQFHVSSVDHPPAGDDVMSVILGRSSRSTLGIRGGDQASSSSCSTDGSSTYDYGASRHVINVNNYSNHDLMMMHNNYNYNYNYSNNNQLEDSLEEIKQLITTNLCSNNLFVHEIKTEEEEKEQNIIYNY